MSYDPRTDELPEELPHVLRDDGEAPRQHGPRDDPNMRDGDSGHGNPYEYPPPEYPTSDSDTGDVEDEPVHAGIEGGATEGTTAEMRSDVDTEAEDFSLRPDVAAIAEPPEVDEQGRVIGPKVTTSGPELPISGFESLTVSQVAERADGLSPEEIRQVRDYEAAHRRRKTLLVKLERLLAGGRKKHESSTSGRGE